MTFEEIVKRSQGERYQYPDIFTDDCGLDIVEPEKGLHAVPSWGYTPGNQVRRATLEITTWQGISANAIHYYGKIKIQGVNMEYDNHPGRSTSCYKLQDNLPLCGWSYGLTLQRPITQQDKDEDEKATCEADIRFKHQPIGRLTDRFNTVEELIELAKEVFSARFTGNWEFTIHSPWKCFNGKVDITAK